MNQIELSKLYADMQKEMLYTLEVGATALLHPGGKGDNTEANWINWFQTYLPKRYQVAKGFVIDSTGRVSDQIDLIIYDAQYSYMVFRQGGSLLIPAESVYAVFEVKPNISKGHIEYAGEKARSVRELKRTSAPIPHAGGEYDPKELHEILGGLLATRGMKDTKKVMEHLEGLEREERLDFVCALSGNAFVLEHNIYVKNYKPNEKPVVQYCEKEHSLVFLLLNLLRLLQNIATVPAIEFDQYAKPIASKTYDKP